MRGRVPFPFQPTPPSGPVFGNTQIRIVIEVDERGLMRTQINKPLPAVQIIGLLLDSMQGQYQAMAKQASMLINPKGEPAQAETINDGEEKENHNGRRGDSGGSLAE